MRSYRTRMRRRRFFSALIKWGIVVLGLAAIGLGVYFIVRAANGPEEHKFLASDHATVDVYYYDDYERRLFKNSSDIIRGTEVGITGETYSENGRDYIEVLCGKDKYYVHESSLVNDINDIILEKDKYVRTSATLYENGETSDIAGFAKKGSHLDIIEYGELQADGSIEMYKVKAENGESGWVYSKYLVSTKAEADAVNEEIYEKHKGRAYSRELYGGTVEDLDWYPYEKPEFEDNPIIKDARAMYVSLKTSTNIDKYIEIAKSGGVNAIVLDFKENGASGGTLCPFDTCAEYSPSAAQAFYCTYDNAQSIVKKIKDAGLYLICRVVVFNDTLYGKDHKDQCITSDSANQLWPSAFCREVWEYNVKLAEEIIDEFGPNEIQFDYVRFPEESYSMSGDPTTDFRNTYGESKAEAIQNFLIYACDCLHKKNVYVSADVFSECAGKYVSAYGQYFPAIANVVDAISGMPYTDHYGTEVDTWTDGYSTVNDWAQKAVARNSEIATPAIIRTWLTCYSVPWWNPTVTCDAYYLGSQAQGLYDAGANGGFMTWNSSSNLETYERVKEAWGRDYGTGTGGY